jgi:DNA processing protein
LPADRRFAVTKHKSWLIALRAPRLGGSHLINLLEHFGGADALRSASRGQLSKAGLNEDTIQALQRPDDALLAGDIEWLSQDAHHLVTWDDQRFPPLLRDISSPPAALFVNGDPDILWQPQVAVIGSRNPTAGGRDNARDFATELSKHGMTITSGLAAGIDSEAHRAALDAGRQTVAVMGTGLDRIYPASSKPLALRIREHGVLVSELPLGAGAKRSHFPSRNRIISGLSLGVLVIEAGLRSGTLITARLAGNQGRDVFALPGSIHNPMAKGCHRLIRDGAKLVETVEEILQELAPMAGQLAGELKGEIGIKTPEKGVTSLDSEQHDPQLDEDPDYRVLWACLGFDPKPIDTLIEQSGLTARAVSAMLLLLELRGKVEAHRGGAYSRRKK